MPKKIYFNNLTKFTATPVNKLNKQANYSIFKNCNGKFKPCLLYQRLRGHSVQNKQA